MTRKGLICSGSGMCYLCVRKEMLGRAEITFEGNSLFTQGNNPWIDGITYNARWGNSSLVPTTLDIKIMQPFDRERHDLDGLAWYRSMASSDQWIQDGNPIGRVSKEYRQAIKKGYASWSDVADLSFKFVRNPAEADVLVVFANYQNEGWDEDRRLLSLGSHRGLLIDQNIVQIDSQLGLQLDEEHLGWRPAASPTPLVLDLNYDYYSKIGSFSSQFLSTIIHEIGHGIGMSHPHDSGLGSVPSGIFPGIQAGDPFASNGTGLYGLNQNVYTIMSYNDVNVGGGELDKIQAVTPMALELLAAQIKYGPNRSSRTGDDIYSLLDRTSPNVKAWACIWDAGGMDTISARGMRFGVNISLRAAEMNAQRPETGMPQEQYVWPSPWSDYQIALDFLVNQNASQPGALLGSGIKKSFIYSLALGEIHGIDNFYQKDFSGQLKDGLGSLSEALGTLYEAYGFIGTSSLIPDKSGLSVKEAPLVNAPEGVIQYLESAKEAYESLMSIFNELELGGVRRFIVESGAASLTIGDYYQQLSEVESLQSDVLARSAKGVAGYISEVRRSEVSGMPASVRPGGGFTIAAGVTIENAVGGKGDDVIIGNAADNFIRGSAGDDIVKPYLGSNKIRGGKGVDVVDFDSDVGSWNFEDLSFKQGRRWLNVMMGDTGGINRLKGVEFLIVEGERYVVESLV